MFLGISKYFVIAMSLLSIFFTLVKLPDKIYKLKGYLSFKTVLPLLAYMLVCLPSSILTLRSNYTAIIGFWGFLSGCMATYIYGITRALNHYKAVAKMNSMQSYVSPVLLFSILVLIPSAAFMPKDKGMIIQFLCCYIFYIVIYSLGMVLNTIKLKGSSLQNTPRKPFTEKCRRSSSVEQSDKIQ